MAVRTETKKVLTTSALPALLETSFPALFSNGPLSSLCFCLLLTDLKNSFLLYLTCLAKFSSS